MRGLSRPALAVIFAAPLRQRREDLPAFWPHRCPVLLLTTFSLCLLLVLLLFHSIASLVNVTCDIRRVDQVAVECDLTFTSWRTHLAVLRLTSVACIHVGYVSLSRSTARIMRLMPSSPRTATLPSPLLQVSRFQYDGGHSWVSYSYPAWPVATLSPPPTAATVLCA